MAARHNNIHIFIAFEQYLDASSQESLSAGLNGIMIYLFHNREHSKIFTRRLVVILKMKWIAIIFSSSKNILSYSAIVQQPFRCALFKIVSLYMLVSMTPATYIFCTRYGDIASILSMRNVEQQHRHDWNRAAINTSMRNSVSTRRGGSKNNRRRHRKHSEQYIDYSISENDISRSNICSACSRTLCMREHISRAQANGVSYNERAEWRNRCM